jgi:Transposase IS200 like
MSRPLRFVPESALVEITTRTLQGRLLLRPSPELNDLILGVIGKAQDRYSMVIHAFVVTSTHAHYVLSPTSAEQLARFMQFVDANIAKEAGRLHLWPERLWSRRYRSIVIADDQASLARFRYVLAHGAKEGLVENPGLWPGANCISALCTGELLRGTWFDRGAEYRARQRCESVLPMQFATTYDIKLTPLPCLQHLTESQRQTEIRRTVKEIEELAEVVNRARGRTPMGVAAILAQDPHSRPATTDRSQAPFVHASDRKTALEFRAKNRAFVDAFRVGVELLKKRASAFTDTFPLWSFPPALPFNAPAC